MNKITTLQSESITKSAERIVKAAARIDLSFMEIGEIVALKDAKLGGKGIADNFKTAYNAIRDAMTGTDLEKSRAVRTLDNAKNAAFTYVTLVEADHLTREEFYSLSSRKCLQIKQSMGGNKKGKQPQNKLSPETVATMVKTIAPAEIKNELECMSTHGKTVEEYATTSTTPPAEPAPAPASSKVESKNSEPQAVSPSEIIKGKGKPRDSTQDCLSQIANLKGLIEGSVPKDVDSVIGELEALVAILKPAAKVVDIKEKPSKKRA